MDYLIQILVRCIYVDICASVPRRSNADWQSVSNQINELGWIIGISRIKVAYITDIGLISISKPGYEDEDGSTNEYIVQR
ncbi:MAG: hypothetical protein R2883_03425 [Caldisericia bacterium]